MEESSYSDEYFTYLDDGSSFRTSLTPHSIDPSMTTRTGMKLRHEGFLFDRLEHACRTSCDALWLLITESSSPNERQYQTITHFPKRNHKLRIVESDGIGASYPMGTLPRGGNAPPIKWKNKGNPASLSLQSTSSSEMSSVSSSVEVAGGEGKGAFGGSPTKNQQYDLSTVSIPEPSAGKSNVTLKADSIFTSGNSTSDFARDLQTVDSKILLRKRQKGKVKDVIRFKNLNNPEIINTGPSNRVYATDPEHQQSKSQLPDMGLPPLVPRQSGSKGSSENRLGNGGFVRTKCDGRDCADNRSIEPTSTLISGPWNNIDEDSVPLDKIETAAEGPKATKTSQKAPESFWNRRYESQQNGRQTPPRLARSLDGMEVVQKQTPSGRNHHALLEVPILEENGKYVEERVATPPSSLSSQDYMVYKWVSKAEKDDVETVIKEDVEPDQSSVVPMNIQWSCDESVRPCIEESKSVCSSDASSMCNATAQCPAKSNAKPKISSSFSVRSFNSAHYAKEAWLRSRPSFECKDVDKTKCEWGRKSVNKPRKPFGKRRMQVPYDQGSVTSVDRKFCRCHIQARNEDETMSVY
jgi:hypothetical protein